MFTSIVFWLVAGSLALWWDALPEAVRRAGAYALLAAGALTLAIAPLLDGEVSQQATLFIGGPYAYPAEVVTRSRAAQTAATGLALLAVGALARFGPRLAWAPGRAVALTAGVFALRLLAEKAAAPAGVALLLGIIWLAPPVGAYLGLRAPSARKLAAWVVGYAVAVRAGVILAMLAATHFQLGTHLDNSSVTAFEAAGRAFEVVPRTWSQYRALVLFPQLAIWAPLTIVLGLASGFTVYAVARLRDPRWRAREYR